MGCFDASCALTGTAIHYGDPCVLVRFEPGGDQIITDRFFSEWLEVISCIEKGTYNDYGDIEEVTTKRPFDHSKIHLFFSQEAWDWASSLQIRKALYSQTFDKSEDPYQGSLQRSIRYRSGKQEPPAFLEEALYVFWSFFYLRKNPIAGWASGQQCVDRFEVRFQRELLKVTQDRLKMLNRYLGE